MNILSKSTDQHRAIKNKYTNYNDEKKLNERENDNASEKTKPIKIIYKNILVHNKNDYIKIDPRTMIKKTIN